MSSRRNRGRRKETGYECDAFGRSGQGAARSDAPVNAREVTGPIRYNGFLRLDSIYRTAVYVTRTHGGVGERGHEASSYPDLAIRAHGHSTNSATRASFNRATVWQIVPARR